jgi:hypothetical protein
VDWLNHPRYSRIRDRALECLASDKYGFRRLQPVMFLCGGLGSERRDRLAEYVRKYHKQMMVFYAEDVWTFITSQASTTNALAMEERLAQLADMILVVVESPGTFAELGAFAISEPLRRKMLPVLDASHQLSESFLKTGPVKWIDADSLFSPSIWTSMDSILAGASDLDERIKRIPRAHAESLDDVPKSPKHLVFFISDLITVFGPCPASHISHYLDILLPNDVDLPFALGLGKALGLIKSFRHATEELYFRPLQDGRLPTFQMKRKFVDLPTVRAEVLGALQAFDAGRAALKRMEQALES